MYKRITAIWLTIMMLFTLAVSARGVEPDTAAALPEEIPLLPSAADAFYDVKTTDWFFEYVNPLYLGRIIGGFGDNSFRPHNTVTCAQALKMILRAVGIAEQMPLDGHWASGYFALALANGWVTNTEITDLDAPISRLLVAKLSANALGVPSSINLSAFTDTSDGFVQALAELSILGGYPDGTFRPDASLTRAELSAIVCRINTYVGSSNTQTELSDASGVSVRTSDAALDYIKQVEGFIEKPYWDYSQYSIGYGSRCNAEDYPNGITKEEAVVLLKQHIKSFETELDKFLAKNNVTLQPHQYDALICLTYNIGTSWMSNSKLASLLKQNMINPNGTDYVNSVASAIGIWCHVGSSDPQISSLLIERRIREIKMFLYADYTGKQNPAKFHTVTFSSAKGKVTADIAFFLEGSTYAPFDYTATSTDGDVFQGWQTENGMMFNPLTHSVTSDLKLTAIWSNASQPVIPEPIGGSFYTPIPYGYWPS